MRHTVLACAAAMLIATPALGQDRLTEMINRLDLNQDGGVDAAEIEQARLNAFATADANGDAVIDAAEVEQLRANLGQMGFAGGAGGERPRFARRRNGGDNANGQAPEMDPFARLDANTDGVISLDEYLGQPARILQADSNGDGVVTAEELQTQMSGMRERMRNFRQEQQ